MQKQPENPKKQPNQQCLVERIWQKKLFLNLIGIIQLQQLF